ncbi:uncharacterized protein LOC134530447 [Bacillus rossius redtenbacheri]|uniref:uncharacterized protein LOC134530447 n=1 Tax=Bacillus rossius redtenbacheri TaxID=93214 RepID=UPI002FDD9F4B
MFLSFLCYVEFKVVYFLLNLMKMDEGDNLNLSVSYMLSVSRIAESCTGKEMKDGFKLPKWMLRQRKKFWDSINSKYSVFEDDTCEAVFEIDMSRELTDHDPVKHATCYKSKLRNFTEPLQPSFKKRKCSEDYPVKHATCYESKLRNFTEPLQPSFKKRKCSEDELQLADLCVGNEQQVPDIDVNGWSEILQGDTELCGEGGSGKHFWEELQSNGEAEILAGSLKSKLKGRDDSLKNCDDKCVEVLQGSGKEDCETFSYITTSPHSLQMKCTRGKIRNSQTHLISSFTKCNDFCSEIIENVCTDEKNKKGNSTDGVLCKQKQNAHVYKTLATVPSLEANNKFIPCNTAEVVPGTASELKVAIERVLENISIKELKMLKTNIEKWRPLIVLHKCDHVSSASKNLHKFSEEKVAEHCTSEASDTVQRECGNDSLLNQESQVDAVVKDTSAASNQQQMNHKVPVYSSSAASFTNGNSGENEGLIAYGEPSRAKDVDSWTKLNGSDPHNLQQSLTGSVSYHHEDVRKEVYQKKSTKMHSRIQFLKSTNAASSMNITGGSNKDEVEALQMRHKPMIPYKNNTNVCSVTFKSAFSKSSGANVTIPGNEFFVAKSNAGSKFTDKVYSSACFEEKNVKTHKISKENINPLSSLQCSKFVNSAKCVSSNDHKTKTLASLKNSVLGPEIGDGISSKIFTSNKVMKAKNFTCTKQKEERVSFSVDNSLNIKMGCLVEKSKNQLENNIKEKMSYQCDQTTRDSMVKFKKEHCKEVVQKSPHHNVSEADFIFNHNYQNQNKKYLNKISSNSQFQVAHESFELKSDKRNNKKNKAKKSIPFCMKIVETSKDVRACTFDFS